MPAARAARALAPILGTDAGSLARRLARDGNFVWLARKLDPRVSQAIRRLDLRGIHFLPESKRCYPMGELAARLKADPNDALGWVRLMKAYTVLGETEKAKQALADARKAFPDNQDAQTAFNTAAKALKIQ